MFWGQQEGDPKQLRWAISQMVVLFVVGLVAGAIILGVVGFVIGQQPGLEGGLAWGAVFGASGGLFVGFGKVASSWGERDKKPVQDE